MLHFDRLPRLHPRSVRTTRTTRTIAAAVGVVRGSL